MLNLLIVGVAPARERGLKLLKFLRLKVKKRRSREGAWIEIKALICALLTAFVAPARERGLKFWQLNARHASRGRSREGAWIEMPVSH